MVYDVGIILAHGISVSDGKPGLDEESKARIDLGIELYKEGLFPKVVFALGEGEWFNETDVPHCDFAKSYARKFMPARDIITDSHGVRTMDELADAKRIMDAHGWKSVCIVTSRYHARRVAFLCELVLPGFLGYSWHIETINRTSPELEADERAKLDRYLDALKRSKSL